jgi:hypothetical protein
LEEIMSTATPIAEYASIAATIEHYVQGAIVGKGAVMKPAFHPDATIYGYIGNDLFAGPIQNLYDWNDVNGPAKDLAARIVEISVVGTIAQARVELDNWTGHRFTDFFNLLKVEGEWKIMNKVFQLHDA